MVTDVIATGESGMSRLLRGAPTILSTTSMPFAVARASVDTGTSGGFGGGGAADAAGALAPDTALVLVAVWLVGSLLVTILFTERAEITG